jgi:hypothetical protein
MHSPPPARAPEPVVPEPLELRASDAERERTVEVLRRHATTGRLDAVELEERLGRALAAVTRADLAATLADLPADERQAEPARAAAGRRARNAHHLQHLHHLPHVRRGKQPSKVLLIAVLLVAIWAVTGAGYFWPIWPLMWFAFAALVPRMRGGHPRVIGDTNRTQ